MEFRVLNADEIQVRVQSVKKTKNGSYMGIYLLYKDARCDMAILDEEVGCMNWKKQYTRDNANCIVSIWDDEKEQWISKEDTGTESNTEAAKGLASDSFKRACVNWGIGRELYTAPAIKIFDDNENDLKYLSLNVALIQYEKRQIVKLILTDDEGQVRYTYDKFVEDAKKVTGQQKRESSTITPPTPKTSPESPKMSNDDYIKLIKLMLNEFTGKYHIDLSGKKFVESLAQRGVTETDVNLLDNKQLFTYCNALTEMKGLLENAVSKKANNNNKKIVSASQN